MRSTLPEASPPAPGWVRIWCRSGEAEHAEVWLATGFWLDWFCKGYFVFVFHLRFLWAAGFSCDYFWFSLLIFFFFFFG